MGRLGVLALTSLAVVALSVPTSVDASDATLRTTLARWSNRLAVDAHGISLSAARRHPRRMTRRAQQFRLDALRARRALAAARPSSTSGRRGKRLALAAFHDYVIVGREWALSGQARLRGRRSAAIRHARIATRFAKRGNRLLLAARTHLQPAKSAP